MGDLTDLMSISRETLQMQQSSKEGNLRNHSSSMLVQQGNWPSTPTQC